MKTTNNKRGGKAGSQLMEHNGARNSKSSYMHRTEIDLSEKVRVQVCQILNETLAQTLDLMTQTKQAHWNVKGVHFYQLHLLFDEIAGQLTEYVDEFAERVTALGGTAFGTVRMAAKATVLPEYPVNITEGMDHVAALSERFAIYAASLRRDLERTGNIGDLDTQDLYTGISRDIDKWLWFLEAHLQSSSAGRETKHTLAAAKPRR